MLDKIKAVDDKLISSVAKLHNPMMNRIMLLMTFLGDGGKVWFFIIFLIFLAKRNVVVLLSQLFSMGLAILMAEGIVKRIVCRVRPCHKIDEGLLLLKKIPHFYSFPSSHSTTSFAMATATTMLCAHWLAGVVLIIAAGIAFSRFYLQAHYLTDVLCGTALGIVCGFVVVKSVYLIAASINPMLIK